MDVTEHLRYLAGEGSLLARTVASVDHDAIVPSCPEWTVRDLARHVGGVHRWATHIVAKPRRTQWNPDLAELVGRPPSDADLSAWLVEGVGRLVESLAKSPTDLDCWSFLPAPSPLAMWARRQAHETTIHRVDVQQAGLLALSPVAPDLAIDGVDELLSGFLTRRRRALPGVVGPHLVEVMATDTDRSWTVQCDDQTVSVAAGASATPADESLSGRAQDLYLALWNRAPITGLSHRGSTQLAESWSTAVRVNW